MLYSKLRPGAAVSRAPEWVIYEQLPECIVQCEDRAVNVRMQLQTGSCVHVGQLHMYQGWDNYQ